MDNEEQSWRQQIDNKMVDLRNEAIVQAAGAFEFGQRAVRAGVGTVFLGVDQVQTLFGRAAERGEKVEADAQQAIGDLRRRAAQTAANVRSDASTRTTTAVSSGVASLLNKLPGVSIAYQAPPPANDASAPGSAHPAAAEGESAARSEASTG